MEVLNTTFWSGPGEVPIQGGPRRGPRLRLGFTDEVFGYSISLDYPALPSSAALSLDPEIKRETTWAGGGVYKTPSALVDRTGPLVKVRDGCKWEVIEQYNLVFESIFTQVMYIDKTPEIIQLREKIRGWRFYDYFRSDKDAPASQNRR